MTKARDKTADDKLAAEFNAPNYEGGELAIPEERDRVAQATADVVVGVPETGDEELVGDFLIWLQEKAEAGTADTMAMLAQALRQADTAESVAEALKEPTTASSKDVLDRPFLALGFTIHEGEFEDGPVPFFASIEAKFAEIDEPVILNTSAFKILAVLRTLDRIDEWPLKLCFRGKKTKKGYTVISLEYLGQ